MATTVIEVKYKNTGAPVVFNNELTDPVETGVVIPDLLDDTGAATGYTLTHPGPFSGATGSSSWATSSPDPDFPLDFFRSGFYASDAAEASATPVIGNLPNGATFTLQVAGNTADTGRDTNFTASNGAPAPALYDVAGVDPVTAPVEISGTVAGGQIALSMNGVGTFSYLNGFRLAITTVDGPSITTADDVTTEGQTATFTLAGNTDAPTGATLNGTDVGALTLVSGSTYSYTAPLLLDDASASLVVTVDGTTASTTISYANSYPYVLTQHGTPNVNSIFKDTQFASNFPVEWGVVTDYDSGIVTVDHAAMDAAEDELNDVALHSTEASEGTTTATYKYFVQESGATGTWQATIVVSGDGGDNGGGTVTIGESIGGRRMGNRNSVALSVRSSISSSIQ